MDVSSLHRMCDRMASRGPDGSGTWQSEDGQIIFGHRRLSVIDPHSRSDQPMLSSNGRYVIVLNGEIYNYKQLRQQLSDQGWHFRTTSDTEVILALYQEQGASCVDLLRGMFAFAIWDKEEKSLFLARDPYGIKPLYYTKQKQSFLFASQVQALKGAGIAAELETAALTGLYLFGSVPEPFTFLKDVWPLAAGSTMLVLRDGDVKQRRYASLPAIFSVAASRQAGSEQDSLAQIAEALRDSVRHHLVADVPMGLFLSGGVDSGALLGLMQDESRDAVQTVTIAFEEFAGTRDDESVLASELSRQYGNKHVNRVVTESEFREEVPRIFEAMDQPTVDGVNTYFASKAVRECGLKVALSGAGADELLGGYSTFKTVPRDVRLVSALNLLAFADSRRSDPSFLPRRAIGRPLLDPKAWEMLRLSKDYVGSYLVRRCLFTPSELPDVLGYDFALDGMKRLDPGGVILAQLPEKVRSPFPNVASLESGLYLKNQLLRDTDWASMAHSVEVRLPFVDVMLLRKIAPALCARRVNGKHALGGTPSKSLPKSIVAKRKTGFSTPLCRWLRQDERLDAWREVPALAHPRCKWAKRWAYVVANQFATQ